MKRITSIALFFALTSASPSQPSQMSIRLKNGTTKTFLLEDIQKISFGTLSDVKDFKRLPDLIRTFVLFQNYPNPFNPSTTIRYDLPKASMVDVKIYNSVGQVMKQLGAREESPGAHEVTWDGKDDGGRLVATGLYFYQVRVNKAVFVKKMLLLK